MWRFYHDESLYFHYTKQETVIHRNTFSRPERNTEISTDINKKKLGKFQMTDGRALINGPGVVVVVLTSSVALVRLG